jgi:hypothetical protein
MSDDPYEYYWAALAGESPPVNQNEPHPGFYRLKNGAPVAIWVDGESGRLTVMVNHTLIGPNDHEDTWTRCCTRAVAEDWYHAVMEGGSWPDVDPVVDETLGDNIRNARDINALVEMLRLLAQAAGAYANIDSDEAAARAQSIRTRALELRKRADDLRAAEKKPHLEAGLEVDKAWQPLIKSGQATADQLRASIALWENRKRKEMQDRDGSIERQTDLPNVRGGYGRAASVRMVKRVTGIDNPQALFSWLMGADRESILAAMTQLAQSAVSRGIVPNGVTIVEEVEVR